MGDLDLLTYYLRMAVGVLGCLELPLDGWVYFLFGVLVPSLAIMSVVRGSRTSNASNLAGLLVGLSALASFGFLLSIAALCWTAINSEVVAGIQGRYFIPILIFLGYSLFARSLPSRDVKVATLTVLLGVSLSTIDMLNKLIGRYSLG